MAAAAQTSRTKFISGGVSLTETLDQTKPSIFKSFDTPPNVSLRNPLPTEVPRFPETKHTRRKVDHNIIKHPVTGKPGQEERDPVLPSGKSLVDHYPYGTCTAKEVNINPRG